MITDTQVEVAGSPAPVSLGDVTTKAKNTPEVTAAAGVVENQEQAQDKPQKTFTQAEVDALVQKRLLKEQRRLNRQMQEQFAQRTNQQPPKRESFRDDEEFLQAQIDHRAEQLAQQKLAERQKAEQSERMAESFLEKAEKAIERYPDFQAVVSNPALPINEPMAEFIAESDMGPDVAYYLGKNPGKAAQIAAMTPVKAAIALKGIEAEIAAKPAPTKPSAAPAPIKPIGASSASTKSPAEMTDAEYAKWRKKGRA